jgi:hypothetical protein
MAEDSDLIRATPVDSIEPCHHLFAGRVHLSRPQKQPVERKRPVVAVPVTKPAPATTGPLYVGAWRKLLAWRRNSRSLKALKRPLEFLLKMRDTTAAPADRFQVAKAAAPFCHPQLQAVAHWFRTAGAPSPDAISCLGAFRTPGRQSA